MQLVRFATPRFQSAFSFARHTGGDNYDIAGASRVGKWRKWYFGLAVLSALFLLESFSPLL